jgi:hypothetical protein
VDDEMDGFRREIIEAETFWYSFHPKAQSELASLIIEPNPPGDYFSVGEGLRPKCGLRCNKFCHTITSSYNEDYKYIRSRYALFSTNLNCQLSFHSRNM